MNFFSSPKPFLIAGPCSAEDQEQLSSIGKSFENSIVNMIRVGIWKPRSKPGNFEGRGEIALDWLQALKNQTRKPICIEVANKEQVELALKYDIDAVWIGARSTVNPFIVQEIAEAIKGTKLMVLIKNPINPDIDLWSGAVERISNVGISNIAAIHRGFSSYDTTSIYRNKPIWAIPIELKRRYKDLPVFCDASHICGNRELLEKISQRALDLDFDGLMLETHPKPDDALSDAKQQITPDRLFELVSNLVIRKQSTDSAFEIENIRQILDSLDAEIIDILGKRMELVKSLGEIKSSHNIAIYQQERWREIVDSRTKWGENNQLNAEFILKLFELIHDKSIKTQIEVLNSDKKTKN